MCAFCSLLSGNAPHWSESTTDAAEREDDRTSHARRQDSARRIRVMNHILAHYGCSVSSWGSGQLIVRTTRGNTVMVGALPQVWATVETISSQAADPLDQELLERLEALPPA